MVSDEMGQGNQFEAFCSALSAASNCNYVKSAPSNTDEDLLSLSGNRVTTPRRKSARLRRTEPVLSHIITNNTATMRDTKDLRVLICTESFHPYTSGIARRFKEIIGRLASKGYRIHVITGCKDGDTWTNDADLKKRVTFGMLQAIEFKDKIDCALPFLLPQYGILREILAFAPDVIHCVEHTPASTFCGALAKTLRIPLVWSSHTNLDFYIPLYIHPLMSPLSLRVYQLLRRTFLNLADYNLTVSQDFVHLLNKNGVRQRVNVWKTGVDSEVFHPKYRSEAMRLRMFNGHYAPDKVLLVSVGRLSPEKNFDFLLKILEHCPQVFLCIVGGGPYQESLAPLFPETQTHFIGSLQGADLASAYASADYFIYASVSETFGQVYLEAMSCATPVIAAEGKQMKEFFKNGVHGFTWEPESVPSAVHALNEASKQRETLSRNCRAHALTYSWNASADQIADVYETFRCDVDEQPKYQDGLPTKFVRGFYFVSIWLFEMLLVILFMLPFMKVSKPQNTQNHQSSEHENTTRPTDNTKQQTVYKNANGKQNESCCVEVPPEVDRRKIKSAKLN